mmetsp:Transcript_40826/g.50301  ORF Transcript_40826/g.50301 Transcript_40826/m.50301 type:complete len:149 (+) Transcript_40826:94-540(+)
MELIYIIVSLCIIISSGLVNHDITSKNDNNIIGQSMNFEETQNNHVGMSSGDFRIDQVRYEYGVMIGAFVVLVIVLTFLCCCYWFDKKYSNNNNRSNNNNITIGPFITEIIDDDDILLTPDDDTDDDNDRSSVDIPLKNNKSNDDNEI